MVGLHSLPIIYLAQTTAKVVKTRPPLKGPMHALPHSVPPALQQATANPRLCRRLLDTYKQIWVSLLWGHCSFLLGPGAHKVLFVPCKSLSIHHQLLELAQTHVHRVSDAI